MHSTDNGLPSVRVRSPLCRQRKPRIAEFRRLSIECIFFFLLKIFINFLYKKISE